MNGIMMSSEFHHLILGSHHKKSTFCSFSDLLNKNPTFRLQNNNGFCLNFVNNKNLTYGAHVKAAAASSSPSLGAPDYSEQLIGGQIKKKGRSIAGIDQENLLDPINLADKDSCFCEFKGVHIHYKVCDPEIETPNEVQEKNSFQSANENKMIGLPMILLHGFGASTFSWHRVMKPLAQVTGSKVLAFDRPAFGLTSRVTHQAQPQATNDAKPLNPYSMAFSVLAALYFIDLLSSKKAVLLGHSAGCLTAVETYFEAPDRIAALILVAPAIVAPLSAEKAGKVNQSDKESQAQENNSSSNQRPNPIMRLGQVFSKLFGYIATTIVKMLRGMTDMVNSLYKKALAAILRSAVAVTLVRMVIDKFGTTAIKNAWYDATQVSDHFLQGYTKPLRIRNWDRALVEFTVAMLTDSQSKLKPPLQKRLHEIKCPVLIITGDSDRLVPSWNSVKLSRAIPGSQLEIISKCGHLPQEEKPDELIPIITKFLQRVFAGEELCLQP